MQLTCSLLLSVILSLPAAGQTESAAPAGASAVTEDDAEIRCFQAVMNVAAVEQNSWCDVLIDELNRELSRSPDQNAELAAAYQNRAVLNLRSSRFEQAEADLGEALRLQPDLYAAYLTRGNLRLTQTRFAEALADYNEAISLSNAAVPAMFLNRALALRGLGELEAAELDVRRAAGNPVTQRPSGTAAPPGDGSR